VLKRQTREFSSTPRAHSVPTLSKYVEQMQIRTRNKKKVIAGPATESVVYHILERMVFSTGNPLLYPLFSWCRLGWKSRAASFCMDQEKKKKKREISAELMGVSALGGVIYLRLAFLLSYYPRLSSNFPQIYLSCKGLTATFAGLVRRRGPRYGSILSPSFCRCSKWWSLNNISSLPKFILWKFQ
jgi:hypothetical protein